MADPRLAGIEAQLRAGDARGALGVADALIANPALAVGERFAALMLRSRIHEALGSLPAAIADVEGALGLNPRDARGYNELGILCADAREVDRAIVAFRRATELDSGYARAWNNLGNALRESGRIVEAESAFARATTADPRYPLAWANLGVARRDLGHDDAAAVAFERSIALDPKQRLALTALAGLRRGQGRIDEAATLYERALAAEPRDGNAWLLYAGTLAERDDLEGATRAYAEAERRDPRLLRALFGRYLALPMVPAGADDVARSRERFAAGLAAIDAELPARATRLSADALVDELRWTNFLLAYQGDDDRELQARFAGIVARAIDAADPVLRAPLPPLPWHAAIARRFRLDVLSRRHGWPLLRALDQRPSARGFEVFVYHLLPASTPSRNDWAHVPTTSGIARGGARRSSRRGARGRARRPRVSGARHGRDAFALAALRLAPLQCAGWGHPVTTGHATIDVFFTAAAMEPDGAAGYYTERLVTLPGIGTRYGAPRCRRVARERIGLPEGPLLLCPQSLFKIHPDNDALFARVLAAVPGSVACTVRGARSGADAQYRAASTPPRRAGRGARRAHDRAAAVRHDDFLRINRACDVMLDTLRWSGGNTSLDALAGGLPIVTLPGASCAAGRAPACSSSPASPSSWRPTTTTTCGSRRGSPATALSARRCPRGCSRRCARLRRCGADRRVRRRFLANA